MTVPFSKLVTNAKYADSPDTSPVFKPEGMIEVGLCIGGRNDEPGEGVHYFDDFKGVWLAQPLGVQAEPGGSPDGAHLIDVAVVSDRILWLEFNDGWVKHSGYHEPRNRCVVHRWPLELAAAAQATNYTLSSDDDPDYAGGRHPTDIGRKSKGSDFAGGTGEVVNNQYLGICCRSNVPGRVRDRPVPCPRNGSSSRSRAARWPAGASPAPPHASPRSCCS